MLNGHIDTSTHLLFHFFPQKHDMYAFGSLGESGAPLLATLPLFADGQIVEINAAVAISSSLL